MPFKPGTFDPKKADEEEEGLLGKIGGFLQDPTAALGGDDNVIAKNAKGVAKFLNPINLAPALIGGIGGGAVDTALEAARAIPSGAAALGAFGNDVKALDESPLSFLTNTEYIKNNAKDIPLAEKLSANIHEVSPLLGGVAEGVAQTGTRLMAEGAAQATKTGLFGPQRTSRELLAGRNAQGLTYGEQAEQGNLFPAVVQDLLTVAPGLRGVAGGLEKAGAEGAASGLARAANAAERAPLAPYTVPAKGAYNAFSKAAAGETALPRLAGEAKMPLIDRSINLAEKPVVGKVVSGLERGSQEVGNIWNKSAARAQVLQENARSTMGIRNLQKKFEETTSKLSDAQTEAIPVARSLSLEELTSIEQAVAAGGKNPLNASPEALKLAREYLEGNEAVVSQLSPAASLLDEADAIKASQALADAERNAPAPPVSNLPEPVPATNITSPGKQPWAATEYQPQQLSLFEEATPKTTASPTPVAAGEQLPLFEGTGKQRAARPVKEIPEPTDQLSMFGEAAPKMGKRPVLSEIDNKLVDALDKSIKTYGKDSPTGQALLGEKIKIYNKAKVEAAEAARPPADWQAVEAGPIQGSMFPDGPLPETSSRWAVPEVTDEQLPLFEATGAKAPKAPQGTAPLTEEVQGSLFDPKNMSAAAKQARELDKRASKLAQSVPESWERTIKDILAQDTKRVREGLGETISDKAFGSAMKGMNATQSQNFALKAFDAITSTWKTGVLPLNPAWQSGNIVSNAITAVTHGGVSPEWWFKNLGRIREQIKNPTEGGGYVMGSGGSAEFTGARQAKTRAGRFVQDKITNPAYKLNEYVDNQTHMAIYLSELDKLKAQGIVGREAENLAGKRSMQVAGDFKNMSSTEREAIRRTIPFYTWSKHSTKMSLREAMNNPVRQLRLATAANKLQSDAPEGLDFLEGAIPMSGGQFLRLPGGGGQLGLGGVEESPLTNPLAFLGSVNPIITSPLLAAGFNPRAGRALTTGASQNRASQAAGYGINQIPLTKALADLVEGSPLGRGENVVKGDTRSPLLVNRHPLKETKQGLGPIPAPLLKFLSGAMLDQPELTGRAKRQRLAEKKTNKDIVRHEKDSQRKAK